MTRPQRPPKSAAPDPSNIDTTQRPFVLIWEVTQACHLACNHCRADANPLRHPEELTTEEGKRLLDQASEFGPGQLVVLSGGDPLTRPDLTELVEYGTKQGLRMTLTPSGTTSLTPETVSQLGDAGIKRLALSLDGGSASAHDSFRGVDGSFEQTVQAARAARDAGIPLQINTTVCAQTVDELPALRDLVADLGAVLWSVFFLVPVGRGRVLDPLTPDHAEEVMEWLSAVSDDAPFGVKTTEAPHYRRVSIQQRRDSIDAPSNDGIGRRLGISAGDGFAFVSHTGELFPSGFLPKSVGNVRDGGLVEGYRESELFRALRDRDNLRGKCGSCEFRHICGGSRSRAYAHTGDPHASDPLCAYVPEGYTGPMPTGRASSD
ncbi:radical SAM/SPASM domain-containing protein [Haloferax mediterranei ATCC 33500]|uniref:Coenzyme PQQ synthesis protein n=1 Tax=Haloferax mediterranei (strain ATCC 33500 / DSM 1411 / JCM 8866 / NBRC 14739 / NCIMB 2177 / R-4) TaxID=523841 RepID=I3R6L4_HALMT|nr:TIGR04053 family radical SAM/SPASM domain-containing protein [Haloferax mediterranei]AFK19874.1 coenzyme PQQ synthesis protein [Haloferax mediterranei ATCC 33500]AHZ23254.1 Fe-S oxidoreductase [Haloferax mediterranei ATCC 33500]ELZ99841.1 coenzyme PQQ synthesis protein [Haloferax mediterranei ATCC 33500]MDX5987377.1 TIGR04053 family radical SAM/SPASM domain-containing protein [Haloferax mediterranei ATCC 33500]QCQ73885.1 radical SAM/SPASM domain-containing protein [Haloferax mediterranei AT